MTTRELNIYKNLVSTSGPPPRRKSKAELARMSHFDRLAHEIFGAGSQPLTEAEKQAELEREDADALYQSSGEVTIVGDRRYYDDGPGLDGEDD